MKQRILILSLFLLVSFSSLFASCKDVYMVYSDEYGNVLWMDYLYSYCIPDGNLISDPTLYDDPVGGGGGDVEYQYTAMPDYEGICSTTTHLGDFSATDPLGLTVMCTTAIYGKTKYLGNNEWGALLLEETQGFCTSATGMYQITSDQSSAFVTNSLAMPRTVISSFDGQVQFLTFISEFLGTDGSIYKIDIDRTDYFGSPDCW